MINNPLNPVLLARILRLSKQARRDIWEAIGATNVCERELSAVLAQLEENSEHQDMPHRA